MNPQRRLPAFIFLILANLLGYAKGQTSYFPFCGTTGNYTSGSTYGANRDSLLSNLSPTIADNGFYNISVGENFDIVYGVAFCRGDLQLDFCRSCVQNVSNHLVQSCPNQLEATCFTYLCTVRYSNHSLFRTLTISPQHDSSVSNNATDPEAFRTELGNLLENLWIRAANGGPLRKVATGRANRTGRFLENIYAMAQCTPDISTDDCTNCLRGAAEALGGCCDARTWAIMYRPSCDIRYEDEPFYNESRLVELAAVSVPMAPPGNDSNSTSRIIIIVVSVAVGVALAITLGFLLRKRIAHKKKELTNEVVDQISMIESLQYNFDDIRAATNNFSKANELGQGGFGSVYRGVLRDGQEIAVKRLSQESSQGELEFKNEVTLLAKLQHRNLVRLLGFSLQRNEKLLVYEFLRNSSLDQFIFDTTRRSTLDWDTRYKFIEGTARGLLYLHEDSRLRIIHRDLKAANVLLDDELNPKIADFGTARLFVPEETQANTFRIVGTFGYMAPEYALHGQISTKSDVFSFGVLILEIISGQRNNSYRNKENVEDFLTRAAWRLWHSGTISDLVDPMLKGNSDIPQSILRCIHIGLLCVQEEAIDRPTMDSVVQMLKSLSVDLPKPSEPPFSMGKNYDLEASLLKDFHSTQTNELTITGDSFLPDVHPR